MKNLAKTINNYISIKYIFTFTEYLTKTQLKTQGVPSFGTYLLPSKKNPFYLTEY